MQLDPDMPAQEMRLHMGEMTAQEMRTARAAIRWANSVNRRAPSPSPAPGVVEEDWPTDGTCIRCGAVPRNPESGLCNTCTDEDADFSDYDAGLLNDFGGGNVEWWQDYIRAEIGRANNFWREQVSALASLSQPTKGEREGGE